MKLSLIILCVSICYVSSLSDPLPLRNAFNAAISVWKSEGRDALFNEGEWSANSLCPATSTPYWPPLSGQLADVLQNGTVRLCTPAGQSSNLDGSTFQNCTLGATCTGRLVDTNQYLWNKVANHYGFSIVLKYKVPATSQECLDSLYAGTTDALTLNYGTSIWRDPSGVTRPRDSAFHPHCPTACAPSRIQTRNDTNITTLDKARAFGNANPTKILVSGTGAVAEAAAFFNLSSTVLVSSNDDSVIIDALFVKKTVDIVYPAFEATGSILIPYKSQSFVIAQSVTDSCTVGYFRLREPQASPSCYAISFNNNP